MMVRALEFARPWVMSGGALAAALCAAHVVVMLAIVAATTTLCIGMYEFSHEKSQEDS